MNDEETSWIKQLATLDPAVVRGLIVSVFGLIAAVAGVTIADGTVQNVITVVLGLLGILAAVVIRPAVTPNAKVVVKDETPLEPVATIVAGPAVVPPERADEVVEAATGQEAA